LKYLLSRPQSHLSLAGGALGRGDLEISSLVSFPKDPGSKSSNKAVAQRLSVDRNALRAFVFVLILSLKKASEKSKGFGAFGGLKFNLLVKTGIICFFRCHLA
jgi:hypothetical protein